MPPGAPSRSDTLALLALDARLAGRISARRWRADHRADEAGLVAGPPGPGYSAGLATGRTAAGPAARIRRAGDSAHLSPLVDGWESLAGGCRLEHKEPGDQLRCRAVPWPCGRPSPLGHGPRRSAIPTLRKAVRARTGDDRPRIKPRHAGRSETIIALSQLAAEAQPWQRAPACRVPSAR